MDSTDNRLQVSVDYKVFKHGNCKENSESLLRWIREAELKQDQLISITMNETQVEDGDNMLTVFYRTSSPTAEAMPLDNICYKLFDNTQQWEALVEELEKFSNDGVAAV